MWSFDNLISNGLMATGGTGIIVLVGLFLRKLISSASRDIARSTAEVDILNMWKVERDTLRALTEELQKERIELMMKLSAVQVQLSAVQEQLSILVKDKKELVDELHNCQKRCESCAFKQS